MLSALSQLPSWELDHPDEDVRGWLMLDESGKTLGRVSDLIVDTDTRYVAQVVLTDGRKFPAYDVYIEDAAVRLRRQRPVEKSWVAPDLLRGSRRDSQPPPAPPREVAPDPKASVSQETRLALEPAHEIVTTTPTQNHPPLRK